MVHDFFHVVIGAGKLPVNEGIKGIAKVGGMHGWVNLRALAGLVFLLFTLPGIV